MLTVSKLSKMQKMIVEKLAKRGDYVHASFLGHLIASEFDDNGNKVWDRKRIKKEHMQEIEKVKKDGNKKKHEDLLRAGCLLFPLIDAMHRQDKLIQNRFSAAFSRSLKRLEKRGLIYRANEFELHKIIVDKEGERLLQQSPWLGRIKFDDFEILQQPTFGGRTNYVILTQKGREIAGNLIERVREREWR